MARPSTADIDNLLQELFEYNDGCLTDRLSWAGYNIDPPHIPGLTFIPQYFTAKCQETLQQQIEATGWFSNSSSGNSNSVRGLPNQAMVFGVNNMVHWLLELSQQLPLQQHWPRELSSRQPVFDTAIINQYMPGDGISPHVDLLRFSDGIAIISLGDPVIMTFTPEQHPTSVQPQHHSMTALQQVQDPHQQVGQPQVQLNHIALQQPCQTLQSHSKCCQQQTVSGKHQHTQQHHQLLLRGGDLLLLHGEARYRWRHGIAATTTELLLCTSCRVAAAAAGECTDMGIVCKTGGVQAATAAVTSAAPKVSGGPPGVGSGVQSCHRCVRVVRGKRMSITLRQLDPNQSMLTMQ